MAVFSFSFSDLKLGTSHFQLAKITPYGVTTNEICPY